MHYEKYFERVEYRHYHHQKREKKYEQGQEFEPKKKYKTFWKMLEVLVFIHKKKPKLLLMNAPIRLFRQR